jgi:hypothetical protein
MLFPALIRLKIFPALLREGELGAFPCFARCSSSRGSRYAADDLRVQIHANSLLKASPFPALIRLQIFPAFACGKVLKDSLIEHCSKLRFSQH